MARTGMGVRKKAAPLPDGWRVTRDGMTWLVWEGSVVANAAATRADAELLAGLQQRNNQALEWFKMDESRLARRVDRLFTLYGFRTYHTFLSYRSQPGYPDFHAWRVHDRRSIFVECKTMRGELSQAQQIILEELGAVGHETYVVRPSDLATLEALLKLDGRVLRARIRAKAAQKLAVAESTERLHQTQ